jgi:hypothetical protein
MAGTAKNPFCIPAKGKHGMAHVDGITLETSGTWTMSRPMFMGSMFMTTVPRYLP